MASASDCLKAIDAAAKGQLSDDELDDLISTLDSIRRERQAKDQLSDLESALFDEAERIAEDVNLAAQIERRNRLKNIVIRGKLFDLADRAAKQLGDASLGLEAAMVGINSRLDGGRLSVDARGNALMRTYMGGMIADLRQEGLHGVYARGGLDREIARELWDLSLEKPTGKASTSAEAKKIAAIIHKYRRAAVQRENRAGAYIRFRQGYVTRQTHDRARMERAGFEAWRDEVAPRLDWDAMDVPPEERAGFLKSAYEALVTGVRKDISGADESDVLWAFKGPGNLARRESASRRLLFKSADDWFDYNERYGVRDVREAINADLRRAAMNTALMEGLGTNPRAMFERVRADLMKKYRSDPEQVRRLNRKSLDWFMDEIDGTVNHANNHTLAAVGRGVRALQSMAKLGGAFISSLVDLAATASERRFQGRNLMDSWLDALRAPMQGMAPGEQRQFAEMLGVGIDGMLGDFVARFAAQDDAPGRINKAMRLFFKLNLLGPWTDAVKRGTGLMIGRDLATHAESAFDALPEAVRRNLAQYGMDAAKWELARKLVQEAPDGRRYMLPGMADELDIPEFKGRKGKALRDEVREILSAYVTDRVEFASPTPGARERAFLRAGLQPGTPQGEAIRFIMQFKAFPITVISRVQGRDVYSRGARSLKDAFLKGEGDVLGLANFIAGGTVLGYFAMQAKELAKGREPRENDMSTFFAAMLQGGGLGIYGDFLLGETNRFGRSLLDTAAGPTLGTFSDIKEVVDRARAGEDPMASTLRVLQSNIPGANLFYTKAAMDYLIFFQLQEMANPGYLGRMERRIKRENNQRYLIPPSRAIPRGGGSRVFEGVR